MYCDDRCKKRGWRRRRAGLAEDELRSQAASLTSPATRSRVRQLLEEDPPRLAAYDAQLDEIRQGLDA
jgi:hypothetical protein